MHYDVVVAGGGPAGLMSAIAAAEAGADVLLIEKGNRLGRKLAISGGGRCNVTNRLPVEEIIKNIPGNGRFLYSAFTIFNNEDIITFFEKLGIPLKEEDRGRMFPASGQASSVVNALIKRLKELHVHIKTNSPVSDIEYEDGAAKAVLLKNGEKIKTRSVIIAVGGKSVPHTGSTGDGYAWAEKAGHTITELFPTEVPITSSESFIKEKKLQGLSLRNIALSVLNEKGKPIITHQMDMIFTHFGISGPAALRCSQFVVKALKTQQKKEINMCIDTFPEQKKEALFQEIVSLIKKDGKKSVKNILKGFLPERYLLFLLELNGIPPSLHGTGISHEKIRNFVNSCKGFTFKVNGTLSLEKAFVTGGGVSVKEVEPKTMASKLIKGLYFAGEILDIHGYTGGFNITSALVTGRIAGMSAGKEAKNN